MSISRSIEDFLREEYFSLLPRIELTYAHTQSMVLSFLLSFRDSISPHERIEVRHRIKACESAVAALRNKQEGGTFDSNRQSDYSLLHLRDLVGFRILAFPKGLANRINNEFAQQFAAWEPDHQHLENGVKLLFMYKYHGVIPKENGVPAEVQIMPMLAGLFSDVEHDALYKPKEQYKGIARSLQMRNLRSEVLQVLDRFEEAFESYVVGGE